MKTMIKKDSSSHGYEQKILRHSIFSLVFPVLLFVNGYAWFSKSYHLFFEFFLSAPAFLFVCCFLLFFAGFGFYSSYPLKMNGHTYEQWKEDAGIFCFFMILPLCFLIALPVLLYQCIALL